MLHETKGALATAVPNAIQVLYFVLTHTRARVARFSIEACAASLGLVSETASVHRCTTPEPRGCI